MEKQAASTLTQIQSNFDYPDLDYPDLAIIRTFSLVPVWSRIFISHDQDP